MTGLEDGLGLQIVLWFQSWQPAWMETLWKIFDFLGSGDFYQIALPLVYWSLDAAFGRRFALVFLVSAWNNSALKSWWKRPRPYQKHPDQVKAIAKAADYGLPSGHTQLTALLSGMVAHRVKKYLVTIIAILYTLLMGIARIASGAHYPQDVIAGLLIGLVTLGLYIWLEPVVTRWVNAQSHWTQIGMVVGVGALMLIIHPLLIKPQSEEVLVELMTPVAAFVGAGIGFALERQYVKFDSAGGAGQRALRYLVGIIITLILRYGLKAVFGIFEMPVLFQFIRYLIIGLWLGVGAPWFFLKTKLARKEAAAA